MARHRKSPRSRRNLMVFDPTPPRVKCSIYPGLLIIPFNLICHMTMFRKLNFWSLLIRFLPNFIYGLLPSNPGLGSNMSFVGQTITEMADKMAAAYQFASICCCGHSNLVIFNRISSKFHVWFDSIKPWFKFEYEFCLTNNNQNGRRLSVCIRLLLWPL